MTENEAIKQIKEHLTIAGCEDLMCDVEALEMAIKALKKVQDFESIGTIDEFKALKELTVTQSDIDAFKAYIDDCMDDVAFENTDWNHSLALALKCMELHKA